MSEYTVTKSQSVRVSVDESKFTDEWMAGFREYMYPFQTIEDHVMHIGNAYMRGIVQHPNDMLKGYGPLSDFGVFFDITCDDIEAVLHAEAL